MANAMSGSRGRTRRVGLVLARRLPLGALLALFVFTMNPSVKAENAPNPPDDADEDVDISLVISSCDDLPHERMEVSGVVAVMGDIVCPENRVSNTRAFWDAL